MPFLLILLTFLMSWLKPKVEESKWIRKYLVVPGISISNFVIFLQELYNWRFMEWDQSWVFEFSICDKLIFWTHDVSQTASYEITLLVSVRPSVRLSVLHLIFFKIGLLVFSDIVHYDSSPWYLVADGARFLKKNLADLIWAKWTKIRPKTRFFAIFSCLVH